MKKRGLTRSGMWICHGIQQVAAFTAALCFSVLTIYSYITVSVNENMYSARNLYYNLDLFAGEDSFEDTVAFRDMLFNSLREIIRYNVAKSQLETNGTFDGSKEIDIEAFYNRKNTDLSTRTNPQSGYYLTDAVPDAVPDAVTNAISDAVSGSTAGNALCYTIEDLLKWNRSGVSTGYTDMSEEEFFACFAGYEERIAAVSEQLTERERSALQNVYMEGYDGDEMADVGSETAVDDAELNTLLWSSYEKWYEATLKGEEPGPDFGRKKVLAQILLAREVTDYGFIGGIYVDNSGNLRILIRTLTEPCLPSDGRSLLAHAESWEDYAEKSTMLEQVVQDVAYNYNEYKDFEARYREGQTNIVYLFRMNMMGEELEVSNISSWIPEPDRENYFRSLGRYIIYRPQSMSLDTNTGINEDDAFFYAFSNYAYAYPETGKIWIAVDTTYPVDDAFSQAAGIYESVHPYAAVLLALEVVCCVIWFVLFLYLSVTAGYRRERGESEAVFSLTWFDRIPTEIMLVLAAACVGIIALLYYNFYSSLGSSAIAYLSRNREDCCLLAGIAGLVVSMLCCSFWYSYIRRCRAKMLWRNSLLKRAASFLYRTVIKRIQGLFTKIYDNSAAWVQTMLAGGGIMLVNIILGITFHCYFWYFLQVWSYLLGYIAFILLVDGAILFVWFESRLKRKRVIDGILQISNGQIDYQVSTEGLHGENLQLAKAVNSIGDGIKTAVETSMKDERLKADLITNVSHDIKTPLTSIINYVDLLKREGIETEPAKGYIAVLDAKSQRLKQLTDDLVEASKISSGNITLEMAKINLTELLNQTVGEFSERFEEKQLVLVDGFSGTDVFIEADSRRIWRVVDNLFGNICKYAMAGTRIYLDMSLTRGGKWVMVSLKNISAQPLNIKADELTERFIRGDVSRSTEGSGLGLSIAKNLTVLQNGKFEIYLDGDLFKVQLQFPVYGETI